LLRLQIKAHALQPLRVEPLEVNERIKKGVEPFESVIYVSNSSGIACESLAAVCDAPWCSTEVIRMPSTQFERDRFRVVLRLATDSLAYGDHFSKVSLRLQRENASVDAVVESINPIPIHVFVTPPVVAFPSQLFFPELETTDDVVAKAITITFSSEVSIPRADEITITTTASQGLSVSSVTVHERCVRFTVCADPHLLNVGFHNHFVTCNLPEPLPDLAIPVTARIVDEAPAQ